MVIKVCTKNKRHVTGGVLPKRGSYEIFPIVLLGITTVNVCIRMDTIFVVSCRQTKICCRQICWQKSCRHCRQLLTN